MSWGADAVTAEHWTNKAGTYGLAAAAWFSGVPVYVLASRDKTAAAGLADRLSVARPFERTPAHLGTLFLTDVGAIPPDRLSDFAGRFGPDLFHLLQAL